MSVSRDSDPGRYAMKRNQMEQYRPHAAPARSPKKRFQRHGSRIYFGKATEQRIFFILTAGMLICGILAKLGWL